MILRSVRQLARVHTVMAIEALADVARSTGDHPAARIAAARELLDRGHGRAPVGDSGDDRVLAEMSDAELERLIDEDAQRQLEDAAGAGAQVPTTERDCDLEDDAAV